MKRPQVVHFEMMGAAVLVRNVWYWVVAEGEDHDTYVCEPAGSSERHLFKYDDFEEVI